MYNIPDLMTFLREEYQKMVQEKKQKTAEQGEEQEIKPTLSEFVAFARKYLAEINQPLNVTYLQIGLGLRLQQGQTVSFATKQQNDAPMRDTSVRITRPMTIPGMGGVEPDLHSVPIFGRG